MMKKAYRKFFGLVVAVLVMVGMLPLQALATQAVPEQTVTVSYVWLPVRNTQDYVDEDTAAAYLSQQMQQWQETITVYIKSADEDAHGLFHRVMEKALLHTSESIAGDYLRWHRSYYGGDMRIQERSDGFYCQFTYNVGYYTTKQQETALTAAVEELLAQLDLADKTDYEKVTAVYDYMTQNITYDFDNLEDDSYKLKFTAYAALIDRTAVCQGYAALFYRLMLELGVDCRIIAGLGNGGGHAWNIVKLDGAYYCVDATWDSQWVQAGGEYHYFLRCPENFGDHVPDPEYDTQQFYAQYPIAAADYVPILWGDANGDDTVNGDDATLLLQYAAGWNVQISAVSADANGDGTVNGDDATLLLQYAAGWNVRLGAA